MGVALRGLRRLFRSGGSAYTHGLWHVAAKRGVDMTPITLVDVAGASPSGGIDVIALDEALTATVKRQWTVARAWLLRHLKDEAKL